MGATDAAEGELCGGRVTLVIGIDDKCGAALRTVVAVFGLSPLEYNYCSPALHCGSARQEPGAGAGGSLAVLSLTTTE
jgi:hypothetical protein